MRRKDRAVSSEEAMELLANGEYGVLSTCDQDGQPYGVPLSYCLSGDALYFHAALEGRKLECIRADNRVSFTVVGRTELLPEKFSTRYESVIVAGKATEVFGVEKLQGLEGLVRKYSPGFLEKGLGYIARDAEKTVVFKISIDTCSGKARR